MGSSTSAARPLAGAAALRLVAILGLVLTSTEHTEIVLLVAILFFLSKTAIFA